MKSQKLGIVFVGLCLSVTSVVLLAQDSAGTAGGVIPAEKISQLKSEPQRPDKNMTPEQNKEYIQKFLTKRLAEADAVIAEYPTAQNVSQAKLIKLTACFMLSQESPLQYERYKPEIIKTANEITADANADQDSKMLAVMYRYRTEVHLMENASDIRGSLDKMLAEIKSNYDPAMGYLLAIRMAIEKNQIDLAKAYIQEAMIEYPNDKRFARAKAMLDKPTFIGKPFVAELKMLDGKTMKLPDDLKGKVVVVDFWATWCGPCVQFSKYLKKFYDKYSAKGVEVIGINLDENRSSLEGYLKEHPGYTWKQAFSGQGWQDVTAQKYGVNAIPSVWVIGKDGNVVSDDARGDLENIVEKALQSGAK